MGGATRTWVLSYDVADDRRRTKLARFLESRGHRVQYSVFELLATDDDLDALLTEATKSPRFDPATDSLRCYALCAACQERTRIRGTTAAALLQPGRPAVL
jgi:CRISPR-associated protein Cas2